MKSHLLLLLSFFFLNTHLQAQVDTGGINLDLLRAPSSPGASLLGFATSEIDKPTDVSAFMASLQSASSGFTKLPSNFAIEVAPFLLSKKNTRFMVTDMEGGKNDINKIRQTFVLSAAIRNADSGDNRFNPTSTYVGLGFKFALIRGRFSSKTRESLKNIINLQKEIAVAFANYQSDNKLLPLKRARKNFLEDSLGRRVFDNLEYRQLEIEVEKLDGITNEEFLKPGSLNEKNNERIILLKKQAAEFKIERIGPFWDVAGGASLEFRNKNFDNSKLYNAGIWTTFGTNCKSGLTFLGLVRYLYNPEQAYADPNKVLKRADLSTIDAGGRIAFSGKESRFLFSTEAVYRSVLNKNTVDPTWKISLNAEYDIGKNQKLTFIFGRNFDGTTTKGGNLVAALNLLTGFGNKR